MPTAQMTELEAVNMILSAAGEDVVGSLGTNDSAQAELILDEVNRDIQARGWFWNYRNRTLTALVAPDPDAGKVDVPDEIISFDTGRDDTRYMVRMDGADRRLYNLVTGSFEGFTSDITLACVELLAWTSLPHEAQSAMQKYAAQLYLERIAGDAQMAAAAARSTQMAMAELMRLEIQTVNAKNLSRSARRAVSRPHPMDRAY